MKNQLKVRCWNGEHMIRPEYVTRDGVAFWKENSIPTMSTEIMLWTGLTDLEDEDIFENDILEFENGDMVIVRTEDWLEFFVEDITPGEADCEDQWRDLYRIERSTIIGNTFANPELTK